VLKPAPGGQPSQPEVIVKISSDLIEKKPMITPQSLSLIPQYRSKANAYPLVDYATISL
jgi:hypothetical protein